MKMKSPEKNLVPPQTIPPGSLPPLRTRNLPEPIQVRKMIGPSIILAGLALGSGEFVLWPYITVQSQFIFFWACMLGVTIQYFINMEIARWTLATGETAVMGFCRLSRIWAYIFLVLNIVPWIVPAWAKGAGQMLGWLAWGDQFDPAGDASTWISIVTLFACGTVLTAGPIIYETVERMQMVLVSFVIVMVIVVATMVVRSDAILAQAHGLMSFGLPELTGELDATLLLGAIAFAGVGGTMNLGQSNYIKDKGYGMGKYIGRITSPITGQEEAITDVGYHFPSDEVNLAKWQQWWWRAGMEHFVSFFLTCVLSLSLLTLISYSIFYDAQGQVRPAAADTGKGMGFIWQEATELGKTEGIGPAVRLAFMAMGFAILLTTEIGVLDSASRISGDLVKVNWLRNNNTWTESKLYYMFLWGTILIGTLILLLQMAGKDVQAFTLFKFTAAMNGGVMFIYSGLLLYMNSCSLPSGVRIGWGRQLVMLGATVFFGFFSIWAVVFVIQEFLGA